MAIKVRSTIPSYEQRKEIECISMRISMLSHHLGGTTITAKLDEGRVTEREIEWEHAVDHPVFLFSGEE